MRVEIKLVADNGTCIYHTMLDASSPGGWETDLGTGPLILENGQKMYGFTYIPAPPPRDSEDMAAFRDLYQRVFGIGP